MFCALERKYKQSEESVMDEYPNSMFVMRVDDLTDSEGYLLAVSTSPMTAIMFIEYLVRNKHVKYLRVGGCYEPDAKFYDCKEESTATNHVTGGFKILERTYKQTTEEIMEEFPNSMFVRRVDELLDDEGYLLAVSPSQETNRELSTYLENHRNLEYLHVGGFYYEVDFASVYAIEEEVEEDMVFGVSLPTIESVNKFCAVASKFDNDIDVRYRHYILDAKSVLGIQSIPRNEKLEVKVHGINPGDKLVTDMLQAFNDFLR